MAPSREELVGRKSIKALALSGESLELETPEINALRDRLRGLLLHEGDQGYEDARKLWNGMIDRRPALVVKPTGTADVVECVNFARNHNMFLSIKGGGHNIAGTAIADGALTIDMSMMRGVLVDPVEREVRVQAGCLLGDVDRETQLHGLATVLGFVSETGVAELTLGGGFGYLTRRFGWTVDNLLEVEIVTADGRVLRASENEHDDLFWAVRGGGGNFGVITSFTYRLHPVGPKIVGGSMAWPADGAADQVLKRYREVTESAPRELTVFLALRFAPPAPFVPREWHGKPIVMIMVCHSGSGEQAKKDLAPLKGLGGSIFDTVTEKNYTKQQSMLDATQPKGRHYYEKSEYLPRLTDEFLSVLREQAALETPPFSTLFLAHVGGAIADRETDDGAVGNRNATYVLGVKGEWNPDDVGNKRHIAWVRSAWDKLRPFSTGGVYVNFQSADEGEERVRASYGKNFNRLAEVKAKYDPQNLFRINRNVSPAS